MAVSLLERWWRENSPHKKVTKQHLKSSFKTIKVIMVMNWDEIQEGGWSAR